MFVIPMVGKSSRFFNEGYKLPKYMLPVKDKDVFSYSVLSFSNYFKSDKFLFIVRSDYDSYFFVKNAINNLGIVNYEIIEIDYETNGQAHTVYEGLRLGKVDDNSELYIFNIDTFRPGFSKMNLNTEYAGYLEVFEGEGTHWSFVKLDDEGNVVLTAEKNRISNLCSNGLYFFKKVDFFKKAFLKYLDSEIMVNNEYYVAPLYNYLINNEMKVAAAKVSVDDVIFCGTPDEYRSLSF